MHIAHFWQFSCNILLRNVLGGKLNLFGDKPIPLDRTLPITLPLLHMCMHEGEYVARAETRRCDQMDTWS